MPPSPLDTTRHLREPPATDLTHGSCPVCRGPLGTEPTSTCSSCETPVHVACHEFTGGCPRFGCHNSASPRRRLIAFLRASIRLHSSELSSELVWWTLFLPVWLLAAFLLFGPFVLCAGVVLLQLHRLLRLRSQICRWQCALQADDAPSDNDLIRILRHLENSPTLLHSPTAARLSGRSIRVLLALRPFLLVAFVLAALTCLASHSFTATCLVLGAAAATQLFLHRARHDLPATELRERLLLLWSDELAQSLETTAAVASSFDSPPTSPCREGHPKP